MVSSVPIGSHSVTVFDNNISREYVVTVNALEPANISADFYEVKD
jgi:hypothetical protein